MPEGPEIRRAADRIAKVLAGEVLAEAWFAFDHLRGFVARLRGCRIDGVEPRGKAMLVRFANGLNIYSHNQLYGRWYVMRRGQTPRTNRQLRLALHTEARSALLYSSSEIEVLRDEELGSHPFLQKLGPDVLSQQVTAGDVDARLADPRFDRRSLGGLLLDQGFVCGLGNYLRSEILFLACMQPELRPRDLDADRRGELAATILRIARRAYRLGGVTNEPENVRQLKAAGVSRRGYRHFVFSRSGQPCRLCGERIEKRVSAGRRWYSCPVCQA